MSTADLLNTLGEMLKFTISFFLGYFFNSMIEHRKDKKTYRTMLAAIAAEARVNENILVDSFLRLYEHGIVFREFRTDAASQCLADTNFMKHASPSVVSTLYTYMANLKLANTYREKAEAIRLRDEKSKWMDGLIAAWGKNLDVCGESIKHALQLNGE